MEIILSFLAKSVDKHSIILVHITYPPLDPPSPTGINLLPASKEAAMIRCLAQCKRKGKDLHSRLRQQFKEAEK